MWMTEHDHKASQQDVVKSILNLRKNTAVSDDHHDEEHCGRGLEHMRSQAHIDERRINKEAVVHGVLDVQDDHFDAGIIDEEEIARTASATSQCATQIALSLAASDAAYVRLHVRTEQEQQVYLRQLEEAKNSTNGNNEDTPIEDAIDELMVLDRAIELSEEEEDPEDNGAGQDHARTGPRTAVIAHPRSAPSTITAAAAGAASKTPVDSFLNRISTRVALTNP